uniref:Uncharacterized protein n=1 Tax=Candidatus Kentrum sp. LFY TaxID=2126342 RepID=A0A450WT41_9GAMM|nr:MAG: hypothetical protein BECKLFY1418C_GA0070996_106918 [Candidatus Kentron sp. LFY]
MNMLAIHAKIYMGVSIGVCAGSPRISVFPICEHMDKFSKSIGVHINIHIWAGDI